MRIWILNHYALPPDRPGGTRHYEFGRFMAGRGHDVTIFASSFSHFSRSEERLSAGERLRVQLIDGVRFVWIRTTPYQRNDHRRMLNMASYAAGVLAAQHRFPRPDVVVGSCVHPMAVAAACVIGTVRRAPFVFEVRDLWPQTLIDMGALAGRGVAARALRAAERFLYRRARLVISLLPGAAEYITAAGVPEEKIIFIPNGIAALTPAPPGPATSALAGRIRGLRARGSLVAGYVGSHGAANGIDVLVRAAAALRDRGVRDIALVLVGDGPDKHRCERLAEGLGLGEDRILFAPPVPKREVPGLLEALDVTLFPLRDVPVFRYGLSSNKLFDYLASGRPVICASALPDNPVRASGGGICVRPEAPEAVADALASLAAAGPAGRRELGQQGRAWVCRHHDMTMLGERFLRALESIAK